MSTHRPRPSLRRNILSAGCAVGLVVIVGFVAERRDAARTPPAEQLAKPAAVQRQRMPEGATKGSSAYSSPAPAPGVYSTASKPVVIAVVKPWIEIARMPQYVQASSAERTAIRNLYWRICVAEKIPSSHRVSAYQQFMRNTSETDVFEALQQAAAPSPVSVETMRRACNS